jgi:6-phosphogluconolactonase
MKAKIGIVDDAAALARTAAELVVKAANEAVAARGRFTVALSGGSTPKALYSLLVGDAALRAKMLWDKTYFFFGDERHVPPEHKDSNFGMARAAMFAPSQIPDDRIFRMKGEYQPAEKAAVEYEQVLRQFFQLKDGAFPVFDFMMLGMGPEGHTASLFPGTKALNETQRLVVSNWVGKVYSQRITMTAPVFDHARAVVVMAAGDEKAPALKAVFEGPYEPDQLPIQLIRPKSGELLYLIDKTAARMLAPEKTKEMLWQP